MSTPPVRVPITSEDLTGPGFDSAASKMKAFFGSAEGSVREARGAAKLFSEEIGVNLNRHLAGVLAQSAVRERAARGVN